MSKAGKVILIVGIVLSALSLWIFTVLLIPIYLNITAETPPKPEVTYAEFPFTLIYEYNGELMTIQDSYVCEFNGFGMHTGSMAKFRTYRRYLKSNPKQEDILLVEDGFSKIYCNIGSAAYYMGEPNLRPGEQDTSPTFYKYTFPNEIFELNSAYVSEKELWEQYKIRIISYEISDPIKNSFPE